LGLRTWLLSNCILQLFLTIAQQQSSLGILPFGIINNNTHTHTINTTGINRRASIPPSIKLKDARSIRKASGAFIITRPSTYKTSLSTARAIDFRGGASFTLTLHHYVIWSSQWLQRWKKVSKTTVSALSRKKHKAALKAH